MWASARYEELHRAETAPAGRQNRSSEPPSARSTIAPRAAVHLRQVPGGRRDGLIAGRVGPPLLTLAVDRRRESFGEPLHDRIGDRRLNRRQPIPVGRVARSARHPRPTDPIGGGDGALHQAPEAQLADQLDRGIDSRWHRLAGRFPPAHVGAALDLERLQQRNACGRSQQGRGLIGSVVHIFTPAPVPLPSRLGFFS